MTLKQTFLKSNSIFRTHNNMRTKIIKFKRIEYKFSIVRFFKCVLRTIDDNSHFYQKKNKTTAILFRIVYLYNVFSLFF